MIDNVKETKSMMLANVSVGRRCALHVSRKGGGNPHQEAWWSLMTKHVIFIFQDNSWDKLLERTEEDGGGLGPGSI